MNILEKYYLQGKGKIILGTFALIVLFIISTVMFTGCFSSNQKNDNENTVTVFNYGDYIDVNVLKTFEKETGIQVIMVDEDTECFAIIDQELVWHGGMNLLGKVDAWDNLIRIKSESIVQELMGMILKEFCDNDLTSSGGLCVEKSLP